MATCGFRALQSVLAGVLGAQGLAFALHQAAASEAAVPAALRVSLGLLEAAGAVLFVVPRTATAGGVILATSVALAAAVHLALGAKPPLAYLVYLAAIAAVLDARRAAPRDGARHG